MDSQDILFNGRANSDDAVEVIKNGDYRKAVLLRSGTIESANQGARESFLGNLLMDNPDLPAGNNEIAGICTYVEAQSFLFLVYNSNEDHTLWLYNTITGSFTLVLQSEFIRVRTLKISHFFVVNGVAYWAGGDFTSFTQSNFYEPQSIDVTQAIAYTAGLPSAYSTITRRTLDFIKWPPVFGPNVVYTTETTEQMNYLYGKMYRFRYRYIYLNNEISALSPYSKLPLPTQSDFVSGRNLVNTQADNTLTITIETGPDIVKKIEVLVSINNGPFNIFAQLNKDEIGISDNTTYDLTYKGNETLLPEALVQRNYDSVPLTAYCMDYLTGVNQICFANFREGFDNEKTRNWSIEYVPTEIRGKQFLNTPIEFGYTTIYSISAISVGNPSALYLQAGDTFSFFVGYDVPDQSITYTLTEEDIEFIYGAVFFVDQIDRFLTILGSYIDGILGISGSFGFVSPPDEYLYYWTEQLSGDALFGPLPAVTSQYRESDSMPTLFTGIVREWAIQYYDRANRDGTVLTQVDQAVYIPFYTEQDKSDFDNPNSPYTIQARATISHYAELYATHYQILTRDVPVRSFQERTVVTLESDPDFPQYYKLSLDGMYEKLYGGNINHQIQVGDTVRFVRKEASTTEFGAYCDSYVELQVMRYSADAGYQGEAIWVSIFDYEGLLGEDGDRSFVVQIYTPVPLNDNAPWREISCEFEIIDPHTITAKHGGSQVTGDCAGMTTGANTLNLLNGNFEYLVGRTIVIVSDVTTSTVIVSATFDVANNDTNIVIGTLYTGTSPTGTFTINGNQTASLPAIVNVEYGDCYLKTRYMSTGFPSAPLEAFYPVCDPYYSDYYISNFDGKGRVGIENVNAKMLNQQAQLLHGGSYIDDTTTNNLSRFDNTDIDARLALDEQFGSINRIIMLGYTLKCLQDRKENSVYIKSTFGVLPGGSTQSGFTPQSQTFGGWNPSETLYGCVHPFSVQVIEGTMFYFDFYNGTVIRSTNNGQYELGNGTNNEYRYQNKLLSLKNDLLLIPTEARRFVTSFHDWANKEYALMIVDSREGTDAQGVVYKYDENKWDYELPYSVGIACNLGTYLISFAVRTADLYKHNAGEENTYYEQQFPSSMTFPFNEDALRIKKLQNIGLKTNQRWSVDSVIIEGNLNYPEMDSEIADTEFTSYEGHLWASFHANKNNVVPEIPYLATTQLALINGDELRGRAAMITISYTPTAGKVKLLSAKIKYALSASDR